MCRQRMAWWGCSARVRYAGSPERGFMPLLAAGAAVR